MDQEIKSLIVEYIKKIEDKEEILTLFKSDIEKIISDSKKELEEILKILDIKFNNHNMSEEEYLKLFRKAKEDILEKTKVKLDSLVNSLVS